MGQFHVALKLWAIFKFSVTLRKILVKPNVTNIDFDVNVS